MQGLALAWEGTSGWVVRREGEEAGGGLLGGDATRLNGSERIGSLSTPELRAEVECHS